MVTDAQFRRLMKRIHSGDPLAVAAAKADMDEKTARKYRRAAKLPSQVKVAHTWRNRPDAFVQVWPEIQQALELNPGLQAKTLFQYLQRQRPGQYQDAQLRTLQRRIKLWRALEGPAKEVYFAQRHEPGQLSQSDFAERYCQMLWMVRERIRRIQAAFFISPSTNGTPWMTWVMSL